MIVVGFDCATQPKNTGLALATLEGNRLAVTEARVATSRDDLIGTLSDWLSQVPALFAIDAPLGWPAPLGRALAHHEAGHAIHAEPDALFTRATDRVVRQHLSKKPLEVGADRIARTALVALRTLHAVRQSVEIEMGWTPGAVSGRQALEVYPAATLLSRGISPRGYKATDATDRRAEIIDRLAIEMSETVRQSAIATDHVLDALLCCVAAADYARGDVLTPGATEVDPRIARREGWIWFRSA